MQVRWKEGRETHHMIPCVGFHGGSLSMSRPAAGGVGVGIDGLLVMEEEGMKLSRDARHKFNIHMTYFLFWMHRLTRVGRCIVYGHYFAHWMQGPTR